MQKITAQMSPASSPITPGSSATPAGQDAPWPSPARAWWAVAVLTTAYIVSFVDRTILSLLIEPVKVDLDLTDTQIALVQGLAFAVFYALMGLPLGWIADRYSRVLLIAAGLTVWCCATAACGLAGSFLTLFAARLFVGAGEAALSPAAMSMISDLFPPARRGPPIGVYTMSAALGSGLALVLGGAVIQAVSASDTVTLPLFGELRPWQATFLVVGGGGLLLLPILATVGEPVRRFATYEAAARTSGGLVQFLREHGVFYGRHYAGVALFSALVYAVLTWVPVMFVRSHGWSSSEVGYRYGIVLLVCGGMGPVLGGWLAARLYRLHVTAASVKIVGCGIFGLVPCVIAAGLADTPGAALMALVPGSVLLTMPMSTAMLALQEVTPNRFRGRVSALYYVFSSIVGMSVGPLTVATFTDYVFKDPQTLGTALAMAAMLLGPVAGWLVLGVRRHHQIMAAGLVTPEAPTASRESA